MRNESLQGIAEIIGNYRLGELPQPLDSNHVDRRVRPFSEESQEVIGSFCGIAEQSVLSAKGKGEDGVLCQVVGNRHLAIAQKCRERLLLVQAVAHRFFQFA